MKNTKRLKLGINQNDLNLAELKPGKDKTSFHNSELIKQVESPMVNACAGNSKEQQGEDATITCISNAPTINKEKYKNKSDELNRLIKDENNHVYNIGIIGPYASGKSSLILTYKSIYPEKKHHHDYFSFSLADFPISSSKENKPIFTVDSQNGLEEPFATIDDKERVEKALLEELFFGFSHKSLPDSRINKVRSRKTERILFWFLLIVWIIGCLFTVVLWPHYGNNWQSWISTYVAVVAFGFWCKLLISFVDVSQINFKDVGIGIKGEKNRSVLNDYIDEIIYIFAKEKIKVVFLEDIDRLNEVGLFTKLKEVNYLLNNSDMIKHKVVFVYAVSDKVFTNEEERSKFFDVTLPFESEFTFASAPQKLKEILKTQKIENHFSDTFIQDIAPSLVNYRVMHSIVNDYQSMTDSYFKNAQLDMSKQEELFVLMAIKNIAPSDYVAIMEGKGSMATINAKKRALLKEEEDKIEAKIEELKKQGQLLNQSIILSIKHIQQIIIGAMLQCSRQQSYINGNRYLNISSLSEDSLPAIESADYLQYSSNQTGTIYVTKTDVEKILGEKLDNLFNLTQTRHNSIVRKLKKEVDELCGKKENFASYSLRDVISKFGIQFLNTDSIPGFIRDMVGEGYLDESFREFFMLGNNGILTQNDKAFVDCVNYSDKSLPDQKIDNVGLVINSIRLERFSHPSILNYDILDFFLSSTIRHEGIQNKKEAFYSFISVNKQPNLNFLVNYLSNRNHTDIFVSSLISSHKEVLEQLLSSKKLSTNIKNDLCGNVAKSFDSQDAVNINATGVLSAYLCSNRPSGIDESNYALLVTILSVLPSKIDNLKDYSDLPAFIQTISQKGIYSLTSSNIVSILTALNGKEANFGNLFSNLVLLNNDEQFVKNVIAGFPSLSDEYFSKDVNENNDGSKLVFSSKFNQTIREKFIVFQHQKFDDFPSMESSDTLLAIKNDKIIHSWQNLLLIKSAGFGQASIDIYIKNSIMDIATQTPPSKEIVLYVLNLNKEDVDSLNKLCESAPSEISITSVVCDVALLGLMKNNKIAKYDENSFWIARMNLYPASFAWWLEKNQLQTSFISSISNVNDAVISQILN